MRSTCARSRAADPLAFDAVCGLAREMKNRRVPPPPPYTYRSSPVVRIGAVHSEIAHPRVPAASTSSRVALALPAREAASGPVLRECTVCRDDQEDSFFVRGVLICSERSLILTRTQPQSTPTSKCRHRITICMNCVAHHIEAEVNTKGQTINVTWVPSLSG